MEAPWTTEVACSRHVTTAAWPSSLVYHLHRHRLISELIHLLSPCLRAFIQGSLFYRHGGGDGRREARFSIYSVFAPPKTEQCSCEVGLRLVARKSVVNFVKDHVNNGVAAECRCGQLRQADSGSTSEGDAG